MITKSKEREYLPISEYKKILIKREEEKNNRKKIWKPLLKIIDSYNFYIEEEHGYDLGHYGPKKYARAKKAGHPYFKLRLEPKPLDKYTQEELKRLQDFIDMKKEKDKQERKEKRAKVREETRRIEAFHKIDKELAESFGPDWKTGGKKSEEK